MAGSAIANFLELVEAERGRLVAAVESDAALRSEIALLIKQLRRSPMDDGRRAAIVKRYREHIVGGFLLVDIHSDDGNRFVNSGDWVSAGSDWTELYGLGQKDLVRARGIVRGNNIPEPNRRLPPEFPLWQGPDLLFPPSKTACFFHFTYDGLSKAPHMSAFEAATWEVEQRPIAAAIQPLLQKLFFAHRALIDAAYESAQAGVSTIGKMKEVLDQMLACENLSIYAAGPAAIAIEEFAHSDDYRSVTWHGQRYLFTANQAACIKTLWEHFDRGQHAVAGTTLLEAAEIAQSKLSLVFREHPAWNVMIVSAGKGLYRLAQQPGGEKSDSARKTIP